MSMSAVSRVSSTFHSDLKINGYLVSLWLAFKFSIIYFKRRHVALEVISFWKLYDVFKCEIYYIECLIISYINFSS